MANKIIQLTDGTDNLYPMNPSIVVNGTLNTTNIPSGTVTTVASMTLTPGTWIVVGGFQFTADFSQLTYIGFTGGGWSPVVRGNGIGGGGFCLTSIEVLTANTTISMTAYQMSGSAKSVNRILFRAVRVA